MAFDDSIDEKKPLGTDMVSDVDDAIRETRTWIKDCLKKISGYPDIETPKVIMYKETERPTMSAGLLGYNTTTGHLEINNGSETIDVTKAIALACYPVGSYIFTSDSSFNPNTAYGGTWSRDLDAGCSLVAAGADFGLNATGGSTTHTNTIDELVNHGHGGSVSIADKHYHYCGIEDGSNGGRHVIMDNFDYRNNAAIPSGARGAKWNGSGGGGYRDYAGQNMVTSYQISDGSTTYGLGMQNAGNTKAYSIMNPWKGTYIWHRTA
jgi:hypothetical protein